jgi:membrane-associated protein
MVHTFTPIVAGMSSMSYPRFVMFNLAGGFVWTVGVAAAGYELGSRVPGIDRYLLPIVASVILVSLLPSAYHVWRRWRSSSAGDPITEV